MMLMQVCLVCGRKDSCFIDNKCDFCGGTAVNTTTTEDEFCNELYGDDTIEWERQTDQDYVLNSPEYNEVLFKKRVEHEKKEFAGELPESYYEEKRRRSGITITKPKCPTCGSENISKISTGQKVMGGALFGLFSSNVRKSYQCHHCGYKW